MVRRLDGNCFENQLMPNPDDENVARLLAHVHVEHCKEIPRHLLRLVTTASERGHAESTGCLDICMSMA